jgi:hypothetical protein
VSRLYVGQYGSVEIMLRLTNKRVLPFLQIISMASPWIQLWLLPLLGGLAGSYEYWVQPAPGGGTGLVFLGNWMATYILIESKWIAICRFSFFAG